MPIAIITLKEAERILKAEEGEVEVSLDLGISSTTVTKEKNIVQIENQKIPLTDLEKIKEKTCYLVEENTLKPIAFFSPETDIYYKLRPTAEWPTLTLSSTPMHRHIDFSPKKDTELKIAEIFPVKGTVLDTCCGLGYTAIMASQNAEKVYTFEKDKNVLEMDKYNPYSQKLFHNPKIVIANQSIAEAIKQMKSCSFDRIIHDPPTFKLSPELYSLKFHRELYRVLAVRGALYHYCPSPHKTKGKLFYPKIVEQLRKCGFKQVEYHPLSSGIRAVK